MMGYKSKFRFAAFLFLVASGAAFAGSPDPAAMAVDNSDSIIVQKDVKTQDIPPSTVNGCGQTCLLQKANERMQAQAFYIINRVEALKGLYQNGHYGEVVANLGAYCPGVTGDKQSDASGCLKNFLAIQVPVLRGIRTSLIMNQTSISHYQKGVTVPTTADPKAQPPSRAVYIPTPEELAKQYQAEERELVNSASPRTNDWLKNDLPHAPNKADYYATTEIPDPRDPSHKITVFKLNSNGAPYIDPSKQGRYSAALKQYKSDLQRLTDTFKTSKSVPIPSAIDSSDLAVYKGARNELVKQTNSNTQSLIRGVAEVSYGDYQNGTQTGSRGVASVGKTDSFGNVQAVEPAPGQDSVRPVMNVDQLDQIVNDYSAAELDPDNWP